MWTCHRNHTWCPVGRECKGLSCRQEALQLSKSTLPCKSRSSWDRPHHWASASMRRPRNRCKPVARVEMKLHHKAVSKTRKKSRGSTVAVAPTCAPGSLVYFPSSQIVHDTAAFPLNFPAGQSAQVTAASDPLNVPALQSVQRFEPSSAENFPLRHWVHSAAALPWSRKKKVKIKILHQSPQVSCS